MLLAGVRRWHGYDDAVTTLAAQRAQLADLALPASCDPGVHYGAMCAHDAEARRFEYLFGVEVLSWEGMPATVGRMRVMAARYAVWPHEGPIATVHHTWQAIWEGWLPGSGFRSAPSPDFERYGTGFDLRTGLGDITLWCPVVPVG